MAFETERAMYKVTQGYGEMLLASISPNEAFNCVCQNGNHPAWIMGHLAFVADRMVKRLTGESRLDHDQWGRMFGLGSEAVGDELGYPSWDELVSAWRQAHLDLEAAATDPDPTILEQPNTNARLAEFLPTMGGMLSFVLTSHEAIHIGQLSTWRRVKGKERLF